MTVLYVNPVTMQEIKEDDPHMWVRQTLEWGDTPLHDLTEDQLDQATNECLADDTKADLIPLLKDEKRWRKISDWVHVDAMTPTEVRFINKHLSALAEFSRVFPIPAEGDQPSGLYAKWAVTTSSWHAVFPWELDKDEPRPYCVDYATAMTTMLRNQHNMELAAAIRLAIAFTESEPVHIFDTEPPRQVDQDELNYCIDSKCS